MITEKSVTDELPSLNTNLDGIVLSTKLPEEIHSDSDIHLSLWQGEACLGVSGLSQDLRSYYGGWFEGIKELKEEPYARAIKNVNGWTVTQMQATAGTTDYRMSVPFRKILVRSWKEILSRFGETLDFYLPAQLNFWMIPSIQQQLTDQMMPLPSETCLVMNYDFTARKNKFKYNPEIGVFQRNK